MKPLFNRLLLAAFIVVTCTAAQAQKPMPREGYWVIESNVNTPDKAIVYFYNQQHQLIYKEAINGVKLDVSKTKVKRHLNAVLHQSIALYKRQSGQLLAQRMQ